MAILAGIFSATLLADPPPISIDVAESTEATDASGADVTYHVKSRLDLDVSCTPAGGPAANFTSTVHFPLGSSSINCSDTAGNTKAATVEVEDTTSPSVAVPGPITESTTDPAGKAVSWADVSATDLVDGSIAASCSPVSGSTFSIGTTTVTCSATDSHGNAGSASFTVTVTLDDSQAPSFTSVPSPAAVEATSPGGAAVSWAAPTATDNSAIPPTIACAPASGSTFTLGDTSVQCSATDWAGNVATATFTVTVRDTTAPTLSLPGDLSVETESPSGQVVSYSASASDAAAGPIAPSCTPPSGSTFGLGTTHVDCAANDGHGNSASGGFNVTLTLVDHTAPALLGMPGSRTVEANGPGGSVANYTSPTATDSLDGPIALVSCSPPSGSTFALGTTTVTCSATDAHGNTGTSAFQITVADTGPPTLVVPAPRSVYATSSDGISDSDPAITSFVSSASAVDLVDPHPTVTSDIHSVIPVGDTPVTFFARDASGNVVARTVLLTVLPVPPPGTPPLPVPPALQPPQDVRGLKAEAGDRRVLLTWQVPTGIEHVVVTRSLTSGGDPQVVYTGAGNSFLDRGVVNGLEYRYVVVAVDRAGNSSAGVAVVALPRQNLLRSPKDGARLKKPPKLMWAKNAEASYYNVQLFRGEVKILSTWPVGPALLLKRSWKFEGRRYSLTPGTYRWYVWPGFGARAAVDYGELLGSRSFQITR